MNYYDEIKQELIDNEISKRVKDYSKNKYELQKYYNVGKLLLEAGTQYGEGIIKEYSVKLTKELGKKYSIRYLFDIRKLYVFLKVHPLEAQLTMSHYRLLFPLKDDNKINYYINQVIKRKLSKRELESIIKSEEYERLPGDAKNKLITKGKRTIADNIKQPILIKNSYNLTDINHKILSEMIMENIEDFLLQLGDGFTFIKREYKIKIGDRYNYIDILLFNYVYNCFVVVELKTTELNKYDIGQIQVYMNYINNNIKKTSHSMTVGIIIAKKDNQFVMEYCSDKRIFKTTYELV